MGLDYDIVKMLAEKLSAEFGMFFLDINDLIGYSFSNQPNVEKMIGIDYYNSQVEKLCKSSCNYENTIINFPADLLLKEPVYTCAKEKCVLIFINISKRDMIFSNEQKHVTQKNDLNIISQDELVKVLSKRADHVIKYNGKDYELCIKDIKKALNVG